MKYFLISILLFLSAKSQAITRATFFGMQTMVQIIPKDATGNFDNDSVDLYQALDLPVQDSFIGPGKAFKTVNQDLSFACAIRQGSYECSIMFNKSSNVQFDMRNKKVKYHVTGTAAEDLRKNFFQKLQEYHFRSTDGVFSIDTAGTEFTMLYSAQGLP